MRALVGHREETIALPALKFSRSLGIGVCKMVLVQVSLRGWGENGRGRRTVFGSKAREQLSRNQM